MNEALRKEIAMTYTATVNIDTLPDCALLSVKDVSAITSRSRTSLWRDVRAGHLAKPIKLAGRAVRFRADDVRNYAAGGIK